MLRGHTNKINTRNPKNQTRNHGIVTPIIKKSIININTKKALINKEVKDMQSVYVTGGGGAGDLIREYFMSDSWRYLRPLKEREPDTFITAVYTCHTGAEYELGFLNPYINASYIYRWYCPGDPKEHEWKKSLSGTHIKDYCNSRGIRPDDRNELFFSEKEKKILSEITDKPYIAIHPFAGLPHRGCKKHPDTGTYRCYPDYKYIETIKLLSEKYRVVVVGRTNTSYDTLRANEETLDISSINNTINMIDRGSLRINTEICRRAKGFIGSHSSMLSAAWTGDVPSLFFYPSWEEGHYKSVRDHGGETGTWALNKPYNSYYEMTAEDFINKLDPQDVVKKIYENISKKG